MVVVVVAFVVVVDLVLVVVVPVKQIPKITKLLWTCWYDYEINYDDQLYYIFMSFYVLQVVTADLRVKNKCIRLVQLVCI